MWTQTALFNLPATAYCERCGKPLSNPISIMAHKGPICRGKHGDTSDMNKQGITDEYLSIPLEQGIVLRRDGNTVQTNVPHLVIHHSPTGFEFGYGGSGPADLALNIAEAIIHRESADSRREERQKCYDGSCYKLAWQLHQDLKWQFVASMDRAGGIIPYETVRDWIAERTPARPQHKQASGYWQSGEDTWSGDEVENGYIPSDAMFVTY